MRVTGNIFFLLLLVSSIKAQVNNGLVANFSFNKGNLVSDAGEMQARAEGISFVKDRFGNSRSACYTHGNYGSYISLGTNAELKPLRGSISLWVKIDEVVEKGRGITVNPILFTKNGFGSDFFEGYLVEYNYKTKKIVATQSYDNLKQVTLASSDTFPLRKWQHIAITYGDNSFSLYLGGVREITMRKNFVSRFDPLDSVIIGHTANYKNLRFLNGAVDDIEIFDRVLSDQEIEDLYNAPDPNRFRTFMKWMGGLALVVAVIGCIVWLFVRRYKMELEKEKEKNHVQLRMYELETRAFKSQMNPHFIFNSLNTIQRFILDQDPDNAHEYLVRFSKLLRKLLESSTKETILLSEEIDILNNYVETESLRFDHSFEFEIRSEFNKSAKIYIPFMLVQPFIENAIWHGLLPRSDRRKLSVRFSDYDEKRLLCVVDDNGVGREFSNLNKDPGKKQSLAIDFITQRLELLSKLHGVNYYAKIIDKKNERNESLGTTVEILIPKFI
jgi:hypothetical protein